MDIALIAGLWLRRSEWDTVAAELENLGHHPVAVGLPGADDGSTIATLDDQLAAALDVVDSMQRPVVVGHSAACNLAWMVADRRPDRIDRVMMIGGFPSSDGEPYAAFFPTDGGVMPFPGWGPFEGADSQDLGQEELDRVAAMAVAVPAGVAEATVTLSDPLRFHVPITLVCPEYSPEQAKEWIRAGDVPELTTALEVSYVDIDSGHWPMVTRPIELARILAGVEQEQATP
jgi:pimeloyl-ACP methyl ester carboxylesterase